jgi:hypothetical protein
MRKREAFNFNFIRMPYLQKFVSIIEEDLFIELYSYISDPLWEEVGGIEHGTKYYIHELICDQKLKQGS